MLDFSQPDQGLIFGCCGGDVEAAVSLHRDYVAFCEEFADLADWVFVLDWITISRCEVGFWSTFRASYGLGVKTSVLWVCVFGSAEVANRKVSHRRVLAVVRELFDDGEPWSAVRAGDEEIIVSGVFWITQFS